MSFVHAAFETAVLRRRDCDTDLCSGRTLVGRAVARRHRECRWLLTTQSHVGFRLRRRARENAATDWPTRRQRAFRAPLRAVLSTLCRLQRADPRGAVVRG